MTPRVSVLMPYRNAAATLEEAVDAILGQRGVSLELVAVDDGSTDDGPARLARLAARHRAVIALAAGGVGIARALMAALARSRGDLVARMDADDVCHEERLAAEVELLGSDARLGAVGTQVAAFPDQAVGQGLRRYVAWQNALITPADHAREIFIEAPLCHPSVVLRRSALEEVGGWRDVAGPEDYDLWLRLDAAGYRLAKVPRVLLSWRHHPERTTFRDPRLERARFAVTKAAYLARRLVRAGRPVVVWGAGRWGRRHARALEPHGVRAERFVDVDPRKIGRRVRGVPVVPPEALARDRRVSIVCAVGSLGARAAIRAWLDARGLGEGRDYWCVA